MADNKTGKHGREYVTADDHLAIAEIADKFNLAVTSVHELIKRHGNDRETLEQEADSLSRAAQVAFGPEAGKPKG